MATIHHAVVLGAVAIDFHADVGELLNVRLQ